MSDITDIGTISIDIEYLFNLVNQRTLYIADQANPALNEQMIDKIPLTLDEYDAFLVFMRSGAAEILHKVSRLAFDVESPLAYAVDAEDEQKEVSIVYTLNFGGVTQKDIVVTLLLSYIQRALVAYIVKEWLRTKQIDSNYFRFDLEEWDAMIAKLSETRQYGKRAALKYRTI